MIKVSAFVICFIVLLACVFDFQYSLLIGLFLDTILLFSLTVLALILSLVLIATNGVRKWTSYVPLAFLALSIRISLLIPNLNIGHQVHFLLNKRNLEAINSLSQKNHIYEMTDMLRYHKRLNEASLSNEQNYRTQNQIEQAFGGYIQKEKLAPQKVSELRNKLEKSDIISMLRTKDFLILTIDGFSDNEYGYVKSYNGKLQIADTLPPYYFRIVRLINLGNGWYFFYTT